MSGIDMHTLQTFANGRTIGLTVDGGRYDNGRDKLDLTKRYIFERGAIALIDKAGDIISGPQNFSDVQLLATAVVEGNERALTTPGALLLLATALLAASSVGIETKATPEQTRALDDVTAERRRQIEEEGWIPERDDRYSRGEFEASDLAYAAAAYALGRWGYTVEAAGIDQVNIPIWPWEYRWWKPTTQRANLVKAGALILADIERIDRAASKSDGEPK